MRRRLGWAVVAVLVVGLAAWLFWPEEEAGTSGAAAATSSLGGAASEGFVPAERKASSWEQAPVPKGALALRGKVVGPSGPVAGATVTATASHGDVLSDLSCECDNACGRKLLECGCPEAAGQIVELVLARTGETQPLARARSDAEGNFVLEGLEEKEVSLWADAAGLVGYLASARPGSAEVEVTLAAGRVLEGKVRTGPGGPAGGAIITAIYAERSRFFETLADDRGVFRLGPLPRGQYAVVAMSAGLLPDHSRVSADEEDPVELVLHVPRNLEGVVTRGGQPVAGAKVALDGEHRKRKAETDTQGRFAFTRLRPGDYDLEARGGGANGSVRATVRADADRTGVAIELAAGVSLSGQVRDAQGRGVAGAKVFARGERRGGKWDETQSASDGRFTLQNLAPGKAWLAARADGYLDPESREVVLEGDRDGEVLVLQRAWLVTGAAVDESGAPVADYRVDATGTGAEKGGSADSTRGTADAGFTLKLGPGDYQLRVDAQGFVPSTAIVRAPAEGLRLVLKRGASVFGAVTSSAHKPLAGFAVSARPQREGDGSGEEGMFAGSVGGGAGAKTDAAGRYELSGLEPGKYRLVASSPPARGKQAVVSVARAERALEVRGTERQRVDFQLEDGLPLAGVVVDATGAPVEGAMVLATRAAAPSSRPGMAMTDEAGAFRFSGFAPGKVMVMARGRGFGSGGDPREVQAGDQSVRLVLAAPRVVKGRLVDEAGRPVGTFDLNGRDFDAPDGRFEQPMRQSQKEAYLVFTAPGYAQYGLTVPAGEGTTDVGEVKLSRGRPVSGVVVDAETGKPVAGALVDVDQAARIGALKTFVLTEARGAARADAAGRYRIPAVDARSDRIVATADGYLPLQRPLDALAAEVRLALTAGATLSVALADREGKAVEPSRVWAAGPDGAHAFSLDPAHPGVIKGLAPGSWRVSGEGRSKSSFRSATVQVGAERTLAVTLREAAGGAKLTFQIPGAEAGAVQVMLVHAAISFPADPAAWERLRLEETLTARGGALADVPPGEYTALVLRGLMGVPEGFAQPVKVTDAPAQTVVLSPSTGWLPAHFGE